MLRYSDRGPAGCAPFDEEDLIVLAGNLTPSSLDRAQRSQRRLRRSISRSARADEINRSASCSSLTSSRYSACALP